MKEVVLELIKTGYIKPDHINKLGYTSLWTCLKVIKKVALELINTGKSKPDHIVQDGTTALFRWHVITV